MDRFIIIMAILTIGIYIAGIVSMILGYTTLAISSFYEAINCTVLTVIVYEVRKYLS